MISFKSAMVMPVVITVPIMPVPCRIFIIGIARIISFVYYYGRRCTQPYMGVYADLCMGRCCCQTAGYDQGKDK
jgi:hypothetical protein